MVENREFRPEGWQEIKEGVLEEVSKRVKGDKDVLKVAGDIYELAGSAMLRLIRQRCCVSALCSDGRVGILTPPVSHLTMPGRPGVPALLTIPLSYKKLDRWSGRGMVGFIPDDTQPELRKK